jgi:hypothetical protein
MEYLFRYMDDKFSQIELKNWLFTLTSDEQIQIRLWLTNWGMLLESPSGDVMGFVQTKRRGRHDRNYPQC